MLILFETAFAQKKEVELKSKRLSLRKCNQHV